MVSATIFFSVDFIVFVGRRFSVDAIIKQFCFVILRVENHLRAQIDFDTIEIYGVLHLKGLAIMRFAMETLILLSVRLSRTLELKTAVFFFILLAGFLRCKSHSTKQISIQIEFTFTLHRISCHT